jgi:hypothetical protein
MSLATRLDKLEAAMRGRDGRAIRLMNLGYLSCGQLRGHTLIVGLKRMSSGE